MAEVITTRKANKSHRILKKSFADGVLGGGWFPFSAFGVSYHLLLASMVLTERSAVDLLKPS